MTRLRLSVVLMIAATTFGPCAADKVSTDPNRGSVNNTLAVATTAPLNQSVSYDSGYTRLHYAIEELSAQTRVPVRCGMNSRDWPVRDLPVVIFAHGITLGKLLETIAGVTDLDLISETIKTDTGTSQRVYRLLRNVRSQAAMEKYLSSKRQAARDRQTAFWDALVANAELPDSDVDTAKSDQALGARAIAKILKEFDHDTKAAVLAGHTFELTTSTFVRPQLLRELYRAEWKSHNYGTQTTLPTDEQIAQVTFSILSEYDHVTGAPTLVFSMPLHFSTSIVTPSLRLGHQARYVWERTKGHKSPVDFDEKPEDVQPPDHMPKDLLPLNIKADAKQPPAFLSRKVKLNLPKDKDVSYADVITALAKTMGFTIVAEDYVDHRHKRHHMPPARTEWGVSYSFLGMEPAPGKWPPFSPVGSLPDETTVGDVLRAITNPQANTTNFHWFYNEKSRLLVGRYPEWMDAHQNLMPESLLAHFRSLSDANGIELDDLSALTGYTQRQQSWWIGTSKDLDFVPLVTPGESPSDIFWRFYSKLAPEDKSAARSEAGLPLAKCEALWMTHLSGVAAGSYASVRTRYEGAFTNFSSPQEKARQENAFRREAAVLTSPEAIRRLTLRIVSRPTKWFRSLGPEGRMPPPPDMGWHRYDPVIAGSYRGQDVEIKFDPLSHRFPIFSYERLAQLSASKDKTPPK